MLARDNYIGAAPGDEIFGFLASIHIGSVVESSGDDDLEDRCL